MGDSESSRDGNANFSSYSLAQLLELRQLVDRQAFPLNFANLAAEIERRQASASEESSQALPPVGRFSQHGGWRGWTEALRRFSPVFDDGTVELDEQSVRLCGSRRTWLGAATPGEFTVARERIRNVVVDGGALRFEVRRRFFWPRTIEFFTNDPERVGALAQQLPDARSAGFEKRWREARDFHARLAALGARPWLSPMLVAANIAVFVAMAIASRSLSPSVAQLLDWGANYGPLTSGSAQWWRLVAAMFLHGDPVHLVLNMWVLWNVGRQTERLYGTSAFAFLYFATGIAASLARILWDPAMPSVGASGAIFGVVGAFLALLLHRESKIPRSIATSHWLSTLAFALFNLIGGFISGTMIDNAAHVGGVVSGFILGWVLVRPIDLDKRQEFPWRQVIPATLIAGVLGSVAVWQLRLVSSHVSVPERYFLAHSWYTEGESQTLRLWGELAMRASVGNVSRDEFAETFEKEIIPFWKTAHERLIRETPAVPADQRVLNSHVTNFARLRLAWAQAMTNASKDQDEEQGKETVRLAKETQDLMAALQRYNLRATMDQRPRALANSRVVSRIRNLFSWQSDTCVEEPKNQGHRLLQTDSPNDGPKMRRKAGCLAQRHFVAGDYQALEDLIGKAARSTADLRDGGSMLSGVFNGLDDYFDYGGNDLEALLGKTSDWRRSVDSHVGAELVEVLLLRAWAWTARGHGYATTVSRQNWELFAMRTEMAAVGLREIHSDAAKNPYWYQLAISIALEQSAELAEMRKLFDEGVRRFPDYLPIYTALLRRLMPRWGGTVEEIEEFIATAADSKRGSLDADERYAQLYYAYSDMEENEINIFAAGNADWGRVRTGFERLRRRYPSSDVIVNEYAKLACAAGDSETFLSLSPIIRARTSSVAWTEHRSLAKCDSIFIGANKSAN